MVKDVKDDKDDKDDKGILDQQQKLDLANMIKANETEDCTEEIRAKKQSVLIRNDVKQMIYLKQKYTRLSKTNAGEFDRMCTSQCRFLFNNYTDLYNKIKGDTLNLEILDKFLNILKQIEDGELNQHEGSYLVGKHLKEMYIDSAMRTQQKNDERENRKQSGKKTKSTPTVPEKKISYKDFKTLNR